MRTLIYKRTHTGDPDDKGRFGIHDCMGGVRGYAFDAVIGVGGRGSEAVASGIDRRINWVGLGAQKHPLKDVRGPLVTFEHFKLFEEDGLDFWAVAPALSERLYRWHAPRFLLVESATKVERAEIQRVLRLAKNAPPSTHTRLPRTVKCPANGC
jgi:hypothetical protein